MEESAEEILARLERYVASLRGRPPLPSVDRTVPPLAVDTPAVARPPTADTLVPSRTVTGRPGSRLLAEAIAIALAASSCVLAVLMFERLDSRVAVLAAAALTLVTLIGLIRRVPFAGACTTGLVVAAVLVRFS